MAPAAAALRLTVTAGYVLTGCYASKRASPQFAVTVDTAAVAALCSLPSDTYKAPYGSGRRPDFNMIDVQHGICTRNPKLTA